MATEVRKNEAMSRYEAVLDDGVVAGFAEYVEEAHRVTFTHTEVGEQYAGQGIAAQLARTALDAARAAGKSVVPRCPYFRGYIDKHDEYSDLVA
ncbi:GNAT family N-acetyltransferase [Cumulibacter soli]|uniref:GNAT family N-acetyltransferase n=1 Tax=Cumulibacter soli TaxID=2546344 RepID=UPI001067CA46|nr:GNAT family N-acetyltransferase [Cumulibacter soli]